MAEMYVDEYVLAADELYKQLWPKRVMHRCHHHTTKEEFLIKVWWHEPDSPVGTDSLNRDLNGLFENEVRTLQKLEKSTVGKYLPVMVKFQPTAMLMKDNTSASVAYQLFQPIKHKSLFSYNRRLSEQMRVHLFREIVQFVTLLNQEHHLSLMYLHPAHIFLTEGQLPCFVSLMYTRKLSYCQDVSDVHMESSFQSPEMFQGTRTCNLQRSDSFQIGVLACYLLCGTVCCEQKNNVLDPLYSHLIKQNYKVFWERIKCQDKPETMKQMIQMLIEPEPVIRIDPYVVKLIEWWQQTFEAPPADTLVLVDQKEKEQKQQQLLQAKLRAQTRPARPTFLPQRTPVTGSGYRDCTRSTGEQPLQKLGYNSTEYSDCVFFPLRIYETYDKLLGKLKHWVRRQNDQYFTMTLELEDLLHPFSIKLRLYYPRDAEEVTVVKIELVQGDALTCSEKYQGLIDRIAREAKDA